jgi:thymidine kinase
MTAMKDWPWNRSLEIVSGPMFAGKTTRLLKGVRGALVNKAYHAVVVLKPSLDTREGSIVPPVIRTHDGDEVRDGGKQTPLSAPTPHTIPASQLSTSLLSSQNLHINPPEASFGSTEQVVVCPVGAPEWIIGRLPECVPGKRVFVGVDEVQFFTPGWVEVVFETLLLMRDDVDVMVVGLDMDRDGRVFPGMGSVEEFAAKHFQHHQQSGVLVTHEKLVGVCACCGKRNATRTFFKGNRDASGQQVLVGGSELYEPRCYEHWLLGE